MKQPKQTDAEQDRKQEPEPPLGYKVVESSPASAPPPGSAPEPEEPLRYKVIEPAAKDAAAEQAEADLLYPFRASAEEAKKAAEQPPPPRQAAAQVWLERLRKFAESPTRVMIAAGVGFGVLALIAIAILLPGGPEGHYDLGYAMNNAAGLTGHLYVEWDRKLTYRLQIAPSDPAQEAGFSLAVGHPPRPEAVTIHLEDSEGFTLCSQQIVLRYDPGIAAADAEAAGQSAPAGSLAQQQAQEAAREQGKAIFQNQLGPDGLVASIAVQGTIPCSEKSYEDATSWSFTPDFPALSEQSALVERLQDEQDDARRSAEARHRNAHRPAIKLLPFSQEGDDSIVAFDPVRGIIETNGDKVFNFTPSAVSANPVWQNIPVSIHYRCDRESNCVIMHAGAGALLARLKR